MSKLHTTRPSQLRHRRAFRPLHGSWLPLAFLALFAVLAPSAAEAQAPEELTLRINDAAGRPEAQVAVVLRTYAPRPIKQGQICFFAGRRLVRGGSAPFASLDDVVVFSEAGDAVTVGVLEGAGGEQTVMLEFSSDSSSVNESDGPLAAFYLTLAPDVAAGQIIDLELDVDQTFLEDEDGNPVDLRLRSGELSVLGAEEPFLLEADGTEAPAGSVALLTVETAELRSLGSGTVGYRYDPEVAEGPPTVTAAEHAGPLNFTVDSSQEGLVLIDFTAGGNDVNRVPGPLFVVNLLISSTAAPNSLWPVSLDPELTSLVAFDGEALDLTLGSDVLRVTPGIPLFTDGFESGDLSGWTSARP